MVDFRTRTICTQHDPSRFHVVSERPNWTFLGSPIGKTTSITTCKACGRSWENW